MILCTRMMVWCDVTLMAVAVVDSSMNVINDYQMIKIKSTQNYECKDNNLMHNEYYIF